LLCVVVIIAFDCERNVSISLLDHGEASEIDSPSLENFVVVTLENAERNRLDSILGKLVADCGNGIGYPGADVRVTILANRVIVRPCTYEGNRWIDAAEVEDVVG